MGQVCSCSLHFFPAVVQKCRCCSAAGQAAAVRCHSRNQHLSLLLQFWDTYPRYVFKMLGLNGTTRSSVGISSPDSISQLVLCNEGLPCDAEILQNCCSLFCPPTTHWIHKSSSGHLLQACLGLCTAVVSSLVPVSGRGGSQSISLSSGCRQGARNAPLRLHSSYGVIKGWGQSQTGQREVRQRKMILL